MRTMLAPGHPDACALCVLLRRHVQLRSAPTLLLRSARDAAAPVHLLSRSAAALADAVPALVCMWRYVLECFLYLTSGQKHMHRPFELHERERERVWDHSVLVLTLAACSITIGHPCMHF